MQEPTNESDAAGCSIKGQSLYLEDDEANFLKVWLLKSIKIPAKKEISISSMLSLTCFLNTEWIMLFY